MRHEQRWKPFENKAMKRICEFKRDEVNGELKNNLTGTLNL
jgi:hypothetical protein